MPPRVVSPTLATSNRRAVMKVWIAAAVLAVIIGLLTEATSAATTESAPLPLRSSSPWTAALPLAPDFQVNLYHGQKVLGRNTFNLSELQGFLLLGVDIGTFVGPGTPEDSSALVGELSITYLVGSTNEVTALPDSQVFAVPTTLFITADGRLYRSWTGPLTKLQLERLTLERLTKELLATSNGEEISPIDVRGPASLQAPIDGLCGDLNDDGIVNIFDAVIVLQIVVGLIELVPDQLILADLNRDRVINVLDAIAVLQIVVGLSTLTDCAPPRVVLVSPPAGSFSSAGWVAALSAKFSEPVDASTLDGSTFQLFSAGPDEVTGTEDDVPITGGVVSFRDEINTAFLTLSAALADGLYRAVLLPSIADLRGNPLAAEFAWTFEVGFIRGADDILSVALNPVSIETTRSPIAVLVITGHDSEETLGLTPVTIDTEVGPIGSVPVGGVSETGDGPATPP